MKLTPGTPSTICDAIPRLIWSEDPAMMAFEYQTPDHWAKLCAKEWQETGASNSHDATTLARVGTQTRGLITAFPVSEMDARFAKTDTLHAPSHLTDTHWEQLDALFHDPANDAFYILDIAVSPDAQKTGLGAALMTHAEHLACVANCTALALHVREDNPALEFYNHIGFRTVFRAVVPELHAYGIAPHLLMSRSISQ